MANRYIDKRFYDAIVDFDDSEEARNYYYEIMDTSPEGNGDTVRDKILRTYAMLFCEERGLKVGEPAGVDDVAETADRLYIGSAGFDSKHWYRMAHHFPIIDDDNYDRFAALVIADLNAGELREAALNDGDTLVVGESDPFSMTPEERKNQKVRSVGAYEEGKR